MATSIEDARKADGVKVVFGDGTDTDTFNTVFQGIPEGYFLAVNGQDIQVERVDHNGITGRRYYEDTDDLGSPFTLPWDVVETIWVY